MPKSITIRNVPDDVRDILASRAAREGRSLQEHLRTTLVELATKPSIDEWLDRVRERARAAGAEFTAEEILAARDADRP